MATVGFSRPDIWRGGMSAFADNVRIHYPQRNLGYGDGIHSVEPVRAAHGAGVTICCGAHKPAMELR